MKRSLLLIALIIVCGVSAGTSFAQKRGPSTAAERARAVEITTLLENDPLNKNAKNLSRELLIWLIEIPDITVTICTGMLGDYSKIKGDYAGTLTTQLSFAETKFVIEHPEEAKDEFRVYLAGVESALRTYQNIKKAKPRVRLESMEELLVKQQTGQLPEFIRNAMAGCK
ncbi:MAG TPA: hypothetical protein DC047_12995 [Blastocatellia bacterium]|nr:hypothetical protein [Blastocatellia bacterium]